MDEKGKVTFKSYHSSDLTQGKSDIILIYISLRCCIMWIEELIARWTACCLVYFVCKWLLHFQM